MCSLLTDTGPESQSLWLLSNYFRPIQILYNTPWLVGVTDWSISNQVIWGTHVVSADWSNFQVARVFWSDWNWSCLKHQAGTKESASCETKMVLYVSWGSQWCLGQRVVIFYQSEERSEQFRSFDLFGHLRRVRVTVRENQFFNSQSFQITWARQDARYKIPNPQQRQWNQISERWNDPLRCVW